MTSSKVRLGVVNRHNLAVVCKPQIHTVASVTALVGSHDRGTTAEIAEWFGQGACALRLVHEGDDDQVQQVPACLRAVGLSKEKLPERVMRTTEVARSPDGEVLAARVCEQVVASS